MELWENSKQMWVYIIARSSTIYIMRESYHFTGASRVRIQSHERQPRRFVASRQRFQQSVCLQENDGAYYEVEYRKLAPDNVSCSFPELQSSESPSFLQKSLHTQERRWRGGKNIQFGFTLIYFCDCDSLRSANIVIRLMGVLGLFQLPKCKSPD